MESRIAEGQGIHHNFVEPHMSLEKQASAQISGIAIQNSWSELLKLAFRKNEQERAVLLNFLERGSG